MAGTSKIEWTDATWNPVRGCVKISPGCKHCYAATFAERFRGVLGHAYEQGFDLRLVPEKLFEPFRWGSPRTVFVNSMSDLFQAGVTDEYIQSVIAIMKQANWHTYQVLTKRSARMLEFLNSPKFDRNGADHIWWGVSVEDRAYGLPRIEDLRNTDVEVRFLSVEPLLADLGQLDLSGISWVIVGGESGAGARPMKKGWVESVRRQCAREGVPFFFKQWGGFQKSKSGRLLNGKTYDEFPIRRTNSFPALAERRQLIRDFYQQQITSLQETPPACEIATKS